MKHKEVQKNFAGWFLTRCLCGGLLLSWVLNATALHIARDAVARVCVYTGEDIAAGQQPDFQASGCLTESIAALNPQGKLLWVQIDLGMAPAKLSQPLGLFVSGKAASQAYLNGQAIGSNGRPGTDATTELPGLMDAVFAIPPDRLQATDNQLVLLMSAHHGWFDVAYPIHQVTVATYQQPVDRILRHYWPSLLPFGVLLLGFFYLSLLAWMNRLPRRTWLLPMVALLAAAQLFVEVYRGLVAYTYPFHDVRILLILVCSVAVGLSLLAYVLSVCRLKHPLRHWLAHVLLLLLLMFWVVGFDLKSIIAILWPVFIAAVYAATGWYHGQRNLRFVTLLLVMYVLLIVLSSYSFMDTVYYYLVAALVFLLMAQQARAASALKAQQRQDQERANRLQQIIDQQNFQHCHDQLKLSSSGKVEWVKVVDIAYCQGAGDYVELHLTCGEVKLWHGSITELAMRLPSIFMKTHRSYLVNTTLIQSLQRSASGAGHLQLSPGCQVPVSRRILPQVRQQLG